MMNIVHPAETFRLRKVQLLAEERRSRRAQFGAWAAAALTVVALHVGVAWYLMRAQASDMVPPTEMGAVMIELAPQIQQAASQTDAAVAKPEEQAASEPTETEPPPPPEELVEPLPKLAEAPVQAVAPLPPPPKEKPKPKPVEKKPVRKPREVKPKPKPMPAHRAAVRTASAPRSEQQAQTTTSAAAGAASAASAADWKSRVAASLNRNKRFPSGSVQSGSPTLRLVIAASGQVTSAVVVASSGSPELDDAAVQTVHRSSPLPPPPTGAAVLTFRMNFRPR